MSRQIPDSGEFDLKSPTFLVGSSGDADTARKWGELDGYYTWTARQMIDHFGFIEANRIGGVLWQTVVGTTRYFHVDLNNIPDHVEAPPRHAQMPE